VNKSFLRGMQARILSVWCFPNREIYIRYTIVRVHDGEITFTNDCCSSYCCRNLSVPSLKPCRPGLPLECESSRIRPSPGFWDMTTTQYLSQWLLYNIQINPWPNHKWLSISYCLKSTRRWTDISKSNLWFERTVNSIAGLRIKSPFSKLVV